MARSGLTFRGITLLACLSLALLAGTCLAGGSFTLLSVSGLTFCGFALLPCLSLALLAGACLALRSVALLSFPLGALSLFGLLPCGGLALLAGTCLTFSSLSLLSCPGFPLATLSLFGLLPLCDLALLSVSRLALRSFLLWPGPSLTFSRLSLTSLPLGTLLRIIGLGPALLGQFLLWPCPGFPLLPVPPVLCFAFSLFSHISLLSFPLATLSLFGLPAIPAASFIALGHLALRPGPCLACLAIISLTARCISLLLPQGCQLLPVLRNHDLIPSAVAGEIADDFRIRSAAIAGMDCPFNAARLARAARRPDVTPDARRGDLHMTPVPHMRSEVVPGSVPRVNPLDLIAGNVSAAFFVHYQILWSADVCHMVLDVNVGDVDGLIENRRLCVPRSVMPAHRTVEKRDLQEHVVGLRHAIPRVEPVARTVGGEMQGFRRQGSPANVGVAGAPGNPGGGPVIAGQPHPAYAVQFRPTAIVVDRPGEGFLGHPHPAIIRVGPVPVEERTPLRGLHRNRRLPDESVFWRVIPLPVGGEGFIEIVDPEISRLPGSHGRLGEGGGRSGYDGGLSGLVAGLRGCHRHCGFTFQGGVGDRIGRQRFFRRKWLADLVGCRECGIMIQSGKLAPQERQTLPFDFEAEDLGLLFERRKIHVLGFGGWVGLARAFGQAGDRGRQGGKQRNQDIGFHGGILGPSGK